MVASGLRMILRADATRAIGAGHAMRLATLGAAWRAAGGEVVAVGDHAIGFVAAHYRDLGIAVHSEGPGPSDVLVVDSYDPGIRFHHAQPLEGTVRVLLDDLGGAVPAGFDVVWNPNPYGGPDRYPEFAGYVLSGSDYLAIRPDVPAWIRERDEVVVSIGGTAPDGALRDALVQLAPLVPNERLAIVGDEGLPGWRTIEPTRFWSEASGAKALVTAAGGTVWEAAVSGIPVVVLQIVDNQRFGYRWVRDAGVPGINALLVDGDFMAHQLRALIPAARPLPPLENGAHRVVASLARLARARRAA
ncbi:MAG: hypothetical protein ACKVZ0_21685 [Gemmatimonadales bacterium]